MRFSAKKLVLECLYRVWQKITCQLLNRSTAMLRQIPAQQTEEKPAGRQTYKKPTQPFSCYLHQCLLFQFHALFYPPLKRQLTDFFRDPGKRHCGLSLAAGIWRLYLFPNISIASRKKKSSFPRRRESSEGQQLGAGSGCPPARA